MNVPKVYADPQEAAKASREHKAVSQPPFFIQTARGRFMVQICFPLHGSPYPVYKTANGIRVHDFKVTAKMVDAVKEWKAW